MLFIFFANFFAWILVNGWYSTVWHSHFASMSVYKMPSNFVLRSFIKCATLVYTQINKKTNLKSVLIRSECTYCFCFVLKRLITFIGYALNLVVRFLLQQNETNRKLFHVVLLPINQQFYDQLHRNSAKYFFGFFK